jgi:hypothetical protein
MTPRESFWVTTAGGSPQAGPTNLGMAVAQAVALRERGYAAFVKDRNDNQVELTLDNNVFDVASTGTTPEWSTKVLRFIRSMNRKVAQ